MKNSPATAALKTVENFNFIDSNSFLSDPHSRLPRYLTRRKDLSSNLKVLTGELYGRYGIDGRLTYKIRTLSDYCGLTYDQTRATIDEGRKKNIFTAKSNGRALVFKLIDQKYPKIVKPMATDSECGNSHTQSVDIPTLAYNDINNSLKEITTTPQPEPPPEKPPEPPPKPEVEKPPAAVVAKIKNIRKIIEPEITLRQNAIEKLIGIDYDHLRYAKTEAMKPGTKNKNALFVYLCNEEKSPMEELKNGLATVPIPTNVDGNSIEMRKTDCYNRNVKNLTCTNILGTTSANDECRQFCPFYMQRMQQDLKLYKKICVEIVHETDKAFLVDIIDDIGEYWIPKRVIKKRESYGDDSYVFTIPESFELKKC